MRRSAGVFRGVLFATALIFPLFSGCGGSVGDVTAGSKSLAGTRISLYWPEGYSYNQADAQITYPSGNLNATLPAYVTSMTLTITGEGIDPPVVFDVSLDTLSVDFAVTPGIRTFTILISTNIPGLSFTATQTIELVAGAQVNLDFNLVINAPPVVDSVSVSDSTPQTGAGVSLSCNATDPDGNPMTYSWSYSGGQGSFGGSGATASFTATSGGSITITCTASDGKGGKGKGSVTIEANSPPVIKSVTASDTSPTVGDTITLTCNATDPDGDRLSYTWSNGAGNRSSVSYTVTTAGSKTFTCTVSDGRGGTAAGSVTINGVTASKPAGSTRVKIAGLFPDTGLQGCADSVAQTNGWIYADEVVGTFSCVDGGVANISGVEYLTGLTSLDLGTNKIVGLSQLSGLTNLTTLDLSDNIIVNVSPLSSLTNLTSLRLNKNLIAGQGVGKIDSLLTLKTNMATLYLYSNTTMSCAEADTLICGTGNTVVGTSAPYSCSGSGSAGLRTKVDISNDGIGQIDLPISSGGSQNCT